MFVWISAEFKRSEEVIFRKSTPNDISFGRRMVAYYSFQLRGMLHEHDCHSFLLQRYSSEFNGFNMEVFLGVTEFQSRHLKPKFDNFIQDLDKFMILLATNTSPYGAGDDTRLYVKNPRYDSTGDWTELQRQEVKALNEQASKTWESLCSLVSNIKVHVPEIFDAPIEQEWRYFEPEHNKQSEKAYPLCSGKTTC
ncbi:MAG: hypothetical protein ACI8Q6_002414 [Granulosicoccus sp.]